jgi:predicted GNAT family acetyltransferase
MLIQNKTEGGKGIFYIEQNGQQLAEMVYSLPVPGKMIVEHTEVDDSLSGQGIGKQLVHNAVEYARQNQLKIIPVCPFTKSVLEKVKEWQDVLQR